jgi:two-component system, OmpR family, sensor histidine kinase KdpD
MTERPPATWGRLTLRAVVTGVVATLVATLLSLATTNVGPASAVAVFMLAVTVSAVTGGLWGGLFTAVLASIVLPVIENPELRLRFDDTRDVVAAVVFFAIALVVGLVVGNAADERAKAARREREARLLAQLSSTLSGDITEQVLDEFAQALVEPLGLASCSVAVSLDGQEIVARAINVDLGGGGPTEVVPLVAGSVPLGTLVAERPAGRKPLARDQRILLEASSRQAATALDRARLDARARLAQVDAETNQLRAAMFSSVTHDLRTPLASIKASVTSLLDQGVTYDATQQHELLLTVAEETDRLNRLVGNILDLAKIRAGALIPRRSATAVDEIVEAVAARLRRAFDAEDVRLAVTLPATLPEIPADPMQFDQVVTNLLENALRHSPKGGTVRLHVSVVPKAVRIRIGDEGPGIPVEEREMVFEAFYRGGAAPESAGSGLGLAIARAIVTAHGGRIWIEETVGTGAALVFELPIDEGVTL